jgi:peptidoglycan hydrolase-like protein with peptidoglycan-binding domain
MAAMTAGAAAEAAYAAPAQHVAAVSQPAALTWPVVKKGAGGDRVRAIQYLLNQRIDAHLVVDSRFGTNTETAVKAFQTKSGLKVDGIVGGATWPKLIITVRSGDTSGAVRAVQQQLRYSYGYTDVKVDGIFGSKTVAAVKAFQVKFGLKVDGIVGTATWNALVVHEK